MNHFHGSQWLYPSKCQSVAIRGMNLVIPVTADGTEPNGAYRRCSNYILILDWTPGFSGYGKDNFQTIQETFKCWDLVLLISKVWRHARLSKVFLTTWLKMADVIPQNLATLQGWICSAKLLHRLPDVYGRSLNDTWNELFPWVTTVM